jgi:hypothetical protein
MILDSTSWQGADDLPVGGLEVNLPEGSSLTMYLDASQGGGIVTSGTVTLPVIGDHETPSAAALGFYAGTQKPVQFLGGRLELGKVKLAPGWAFDALSLSYQSATDTWTASGGLTAPIGSLDASGSLIGGRLDSIGVSIGGAALPLGDSGFFFTDLGGAVSGLAKPPLKLSASTGGVWGDPKSDFNPIYLDNVTLTVDLSGAVSLDGKVSLITKDDSPATGQVDLSVRLSPFSATGKLSTSVDLSPLAKLSYDAGVGFTAHAFTAEGTGKLQMHLLDGSGQEVISSSGIGATGTLCAGVAFLRVCQTLGFAAKWAQLAGLIHGNLGVLGQIVGGDPQSLVTVHATAAAASQPASIHVPTGRTLLFLDVTSPSVPPALQLIAPNGASYTTSAADGRLLVSTDPALNLTSVTVLRPRPGVWRIEGAGDAAGLPLQVHAETIHPVQALHGSGGRAGSRRHGLGAKGRVTVRWRSSGLPPRTSITILRSTRRGSIVGALRLRSGLPSRGSMTINARRLRPGANWLILVAKLNGVPFSQVDLAGPVWIAKHHASR